MNVADIFGVIGLHNCMLVSQTKKGRKFKNSGLRLCIILIWHAGVLAIPRKESAVPSRVPSKCRGHIS